MLKVEGDVVFCARPLQLVLSPIGEDIILNAVFPSVMLVEPTPRTAVDQIVTHYDTGRPFIGVEAPSTVVVGNDVMEMVVMNHGARGDSQRIDAPHITQNTLPDRVGMVET